MSYFGATGTPVLDFWWRLLWVSKPEWFCLIRIAEANIMYISWDPPLVLHIADLLTDSIAGHWTVHFLHKDITVWQQWVLNLRSTDHECCALTIRPGVRSIFFQATFLDLIVRVFDRALSNIHCLISYCLLKFFDNLFSLENYSIFQYVAKFRS